jgi:hypothetical protein
MVERILANPGDFYINVHNPSHPGGAIRGQLQKAGMKSTCARMFPCGRKL